MSDTSDSTSELNADPTPPTFDAQLEDIFAKRFPEVSDADPDPSTDDAGAPPVVPTEPAAGTEDAPPAVEPTGAPAADTTVDTAPVGDPATGTPGPVDFDPVKFGIANPEPVPAPAATILAIPTPDGGTFELDVPTAESLLALGAWSQGLAPETREAFAAIEQGQAIAVDRQDFERFNAWRQTQDAGNDYDDLDPAVAQRIAQLEAENAQLRVQPLANQNSAQADQATSAFLDTANAYAAQRGLSEAEMGTVFQQALNANVIGAFAEDMRVYSPSGVLLRDADYAEVARRAFDFALVQNPHLHNRILTAAADNFVGGAPATDTQSGAPAPDPTAIKKARAGSLASAPSAALATPPIDLRSMSPQDITAAMTAEISAAMRS
jgi:hypothetical protein